MGFCQKKTDRGDTEVSVLKKMPKGCTINQRRGMPKHNFWRADTDRNQVLHR